MNPAISLNQRQWVSAWLLVLFVGSGCSALIYEVVWLQQLQLVVGLTNVSLGVLLGTYMGGMCLGSLLLPRLVSRRSHPLAVYASLEGGIALLGVITLFLLPWVAHVYTESVGRALPGALLRGLVAALCLLPSTLLMGATLPAVARWVESTRDGVSWLGFFYGGNIAGAVLGCLLAGFYLLRLYDLTTATFTAAALNLLVAGGALVLTAWTGGVKKADAVLLGADPEAVSSQARSQAETGQRPACGRWPIYLTVALSGMSALGAEVVWTRALALIFGGTVYTFSIILAVFLAGLGIGSLAGAHLGRVVKDPRALLGWCQILLIGAVAWTSAMIVWSLPYWPINPGLALSPWYTFQLDLARCLWAILPATLLWGASFPLALAALAGANQDSGKLVGGAYAANTIGAIVGALSFSLLVIPLAGTQTGERALLGLAWFGGAMAWLPRCARAGQSDTRFGWPAVRILGALGVSLFLGWHVGPAPWGMVAYGRFMATYGTRLSPTIRPESEVPTVSGTPDIFCTYVGEGLNGSVAVTKWRSGVRNFHSAGKVQASTEPRDMRLQRMLGHLSALAHRKPESVLVVACGAGVTAGSFVVYPEVKRIVICDIEPLVPNVVAPMFARENYNVIRDARTEVVSDDGRHFIRTTSEKFDIITSDPIDPWVKGCAALNTVEYFQSCKRHLNPGGVVSLWIPLYESNSETVKSLIATFFTAFPHGTIWSNDSEGEGYDAVLLGQAEPSQFDVDALQDRLDRPEYAGVRQSLADVGFRSGVSLLGTFAGEALSLQPWTRDAQINTDRNLRLQYLAGFGVNSFAAPEIMSEILHYRRFPDSLFTGSPRRTQMLRAWFGGGTTPASPSPPKTGEPVVPSVDVRAAR